MDDSTTNNTNEGTPVAVVVTTGVRQRLEKYQNECRKKKEPIKKEQLQVGPLDDSMTDVAKYMHSPAKIHRPKFVVEPGTASGTSAKMMMLDLESESSETTDTMPGSSRSVASLKKGTRASSTGSRFGKGSTSSKAKDSAEQKERDAAEAAAKVQLGELLQQTEVSGGAAAGTDKSTTAATTTETDVAQTPFTAFRLRYMEAVSKLKPEPVDVQVIKKTTADLQAAKRALKLKRHEEYVRKQTFSRLVQTWDVYEQAAQDKPKIRSEDDKQAEQKMARLEDEVTEQWAGYADKVVQAHQTIVQQQQQMPDYQEEEEDDDDDDLAYWIAEAKRLRALAETRKKARAAAEKRKAVEEEEEYWIQEGLKLREANRRQHLQQSPTKNQSSSSPTTSDKGLQRRGGGNRHLRPGMIRGNSFGPGDEGYYENNGDAEEGGDENDRQRTRVGPDGRIEDWSDNDDEDENEQDDSKGTGKANKQSWQTDDSRPRRRAGRRPASNHRSNGNDNDEEEGSNGEWNEEPEEEEEEAPKPRSRRGVNSLRPGMMRGNSFDIDEPPPRRPPVTDESAADEEDDDDDEQDLSARQGGSYLGASRSNIQQGRPFGREVLSDSDDDDGVPAPEGSERSRQRRKHKENGEGIGTDKNKDKSLQGGGDSKSSFRRVGPDGRIEWSDSDDEEEAGEQREQSNRDNSSTRGDVDGDESLMQTPEAEKKKKVKKPVELIEDEPLECPGTPRNPDGTVWSNPLKAWANKPKKVKEIGAQIIVKVPTKTDCWRKTRHNFIMDNAPYYWHKVTGDFQVLVKVRGQFSKMYDKAGIMIRLDEENWILSGMEHFNDKMNHSTCVTRDFTDWSLAPLPENAEKVGIWFCLKRMGNAYESFYSIDGKVWVQTRQGLFTDRPVLKVGIVCACPMGDPYKVTFEYYRVQQI
jgi:uncharacterized protein